jgi:hypothetical protein
MRNPRTRALRAKGDQNPAQWRPAQRTFWCTYARAWVDVKHHYRLSITQAENKALDQMLDTCAGEPIHP